MPLKIPFFRLGNWKHPIYGDMRITQDTFDQVLANFKANVLGRPPFVRIGHDKPGAQSFGHMPAEGWVTAIKQEGDILFGEVEPTTKEAEENIRTKRFRFSSAEYTPQGVNRETGQSVGALLSAIALTNEPFLTKLPEATLLADGPDMFYLDFSESEGGKDQMPDTEVKGMLQKLSDAFNQFAAGFKPAPANPPAADDTARQLAELKTQMRQMAALQTQIAALNEANKTLSAQIDAETGKRRLAEVEQEGAAMIAQGIPPVMVDQWKALALADGGAVIKLADGKGGEVQLTQAEAMKKMLLALPAEHRVKFGQAGGQAAPAAEEEMKLACKEDVVALGGAVDEKTGKYLI